MVTLSLWIAVIVGFAISWRIFTVGEELRREMNPAHEVRIQTLIDWFNITAHGSCLLMWHNIFLYHLGGGWVAMFVVMIIVHLAVIADKATDR